MPAKEATTLNWYMFLRNTVARPFVKAGYKARIEGAENVPTTGGVVLASNHVAAPETVIMPALMTRKVTFPAKAELFKGDRGIASKAIAWALKAIGMVPLDRTSGRAALEGLGPVLEVLRGGGMVGIYPEGTRSVDGRLYKGKTGVARLALTAGVPVVPIAMVHAEETGKLFGIPMVDHPIVRVGKPLDFTAYHGCADDRRVIRWVTDEIMNAIRELSGQAYVDVYGTSIKYGGMTAAEAEARALPRPGGGPAPEPRDRPDGRSSERPLA